MKFAIRKLGTHTQMEPYAVVSYTISCLSYSLRELFVDISQGLKKLELLNLILINCLYIYKRNPTET